MNVLFLSPGFPPNLRHFCERLADRGACVLGLGDSPVHDLPDELRRALAAYAWVPSLADRDAVRHATAALIERHGRLDRIEAATEMWLDLAGTLRDEFGIAGPSGARVALQRSKTWMAKLFDRAGIATIAGRRVHDSDDARAWASELGFPVIVKPDAGAGASQTFRLDDEDALTAAFAKHALRGHIVQPFIDAEIVTYDGLVDAAGHVVYATSHRYDTGIMQVVSGALDGHYYSLRELPPGLDDLGRRAVAAFELRAQLFHLEVFETPRGYIGLEMNLRAPGGFTTDMMNYAADIDVYDLWARAVLGEHLAGFAYDRRYHVGHAGRRDGRAYRHDEAALTELLGPRLLQRRRLPRELAVMQGDVMFLLRSPDLDQLRADIALVQALAA